MARIMGYVLGAAMLADGLSFGIQPRWAFRLWRDRISPSCPAEVNGVMDEYSHLSDTALRALAAWEVTAAAVMLWLAGRD